MLQLRFRSKARDIDTDVGRMTPVRLAVERALNDANREASGLRERLEQARSSAAFLYGDDLTSDTAGDPKLHGKLAEAEELVVRAQIRLQYLERQIDMLKSISEIVDRVVSPSNNAFTEKTPSSPNR